MNLIKKILAIFIFSLSIFIMTPALAGTTNPADTSAVDGLNDAAGKVGAYQSQVKTTPDPKAAVIARVGNIVALILSFVGVIFLILTIYAGLMWMTATGNSGQVEKAKDLLINAAIGLAIVTAAYSITSFIGNALVK